MANKQGGGLGTGRKGKERGSPDTKIEIVYPNIKNEIVYGNGYVYVIVYVLLSRNIIKQVFEIKPILRYGRRRLNLDI